MDSRQIYKVIGLMSGTSLDGLDIAYCTFTKTEKDWAYKIHKAVTVPYSASWIKKLSNAHSLSAQELLALDSEYGSFLGERCLSFIKEHKLKVDFIASHGHTIFHQPNKKFTYQLGNGNSIHATSKIPIIYDFRSLDVAHGGEGAPLVPVGDKFLFREDDVCLNLGGIANLSMDVKGARVAFDICFVNMGLNYLASKIGKSFDKNGELSASGEVNKKMLSELNLIYKKFHTKRPSLGRELFEQKIKPILDNESISIEDRLRTFTESAASEILRAIPSTKSTLNVLCTGGGAFNSFLITTLLNYCPDNTMIIIPDDEVVKFKEALVFAFLGVLRLRGEANCLKSVTGATQNSSSGLMIGMK